MISLLSRTILFCPLGERFLLIDNGELPEVTDDRVRTWARREGQLRVSEISVKRTECEEHDEEQNPESGLVERGG